MKTLLRSDLAALGKLERVAFATSLPGVKPVALIGTASTTGVSNLAPFSSLLHLGSNPILLGLVSRPDLVERHTLANILARRAWTVNHLTPALVNAAHQCSARYPTGVSEFVACGLTEVWQPGFAAPHVAESPFRLGLELVEVVDIAANGTKLVVGEVVWVELPASSCRDDGSVALETMDLVASTALDTYFTVQPIGRLAYAKPDRPPTRV